MLNLVLSLGYHDFKSNWGYAAFFSLFKYITNFIYEF